MSQRPRRRASQYQLSYLWTRLDLFNSKIKTGTGTKLRRFQLANNLFVIYDSQKKIALSNDKTIIRASSTNAAA